MVDLRQQHTDHAQDKLGMTFGVIFFQERPWQAAND